MYILLLFIPLLSFFISSNFGRKIGVKGVKIFNVSLLIVTFIISSLSWVEVVIYESNIAELIATLTILANSGN